MSERCYEETGAKRNASETARRAIGTGGTQLCKDAMNMKESPHNCNMLSSAETWLTAQRKTYGVVLCNCTCGLSSSHVGVCNENECSRHY